MTRIALTFGLISAALMSAMALATVPLLNSVGTGKTDVLGYAAMFASALVVFFGVRAYRERAPDSRVTSPKRRARPRR